MINKAKKKPAPNKEEALVICSDFDDECDDVKNKTKCYLYDCEKGICPYLNNEGE